MIIYDSLDGCDSCKGSCVALGNFDGVHLGHQAILGTAVREARARELDAVCFTFSNHPRNLFKHISDRQEDSGVKYISSEEEKMKMLENIGIDIVYNIPFTEKIMTMPPQDFIEEILIDKFNAKGVSCGFNYRYGYKAQGTANTLKEYGETHGLDVFVEDAVEIDGTVVSSTSVRDLIEKGDMEKTREYLGRFYSVTGVVTKGNHIGTKLGFPTANISIEEERIAPPNGVYYTYALIDGKKYASVANIGVKPTIGTFSKSIEVFLFDFDGELYNKEITVEFILWERPEQKFESVEKLRDRIAIDCQMAQEYHDMHEME